jgi:protein SCO1/2
MSNFPAEKRAASSSRLLTLVGLVVVIAAGGAVLLFILNNRPAPASSNAAAVVSEGDTFDGVTNVNPPRQLQDFTLTNQNNQPTSLRSLRGKYTLMFFGYTHCPDVCPLTLLEYKQVKEALGDKAGQMNFVFVSVDGERDTPDVMANYVNRFDPSFIGLTTNDDATLKRLAGDYSLYYAKRADASGSADSYLVDHTSSSFLVDKEGQLVAVYTYGLKANQITADIQKRLEG